MEDAGLVGVEPQISVAVRQDVLLEPQRRQIKIVDDVLATSSPAAHWRVDRHMQLVDFARAARLLDAPHPLFGDDMDFERVLGRRQRGELISTPPTRK